MANSSCQEEYPYSYEVFEDAPTVRIVLYTMAPILVFLTVLMFIESTIYVFKAIPRKSRRNKIIWIFCIYPTFSVCSVVALFIPRASLFTRFTSSIQLSITMYQFLKLIMDYYGGRDAMLATLQSQPVKLNTFPLMLCCVCLPKVSMTYNTQRRLRRLVMQVALICPIVYFIVVILWVDDRYKSGEVSIREPFVYLSIAALVSTIIAMQALSVVYTASTQALKKFKITPKYFSVQLALFFGNIQPVLLGLLASFEVIPCIEPFPTKSRSEVIHNFLVVFEFFVLGVMARIYFRTKRLGNLDQLVSEKCDPEDADISKDGINGEENGVVVKGDAEKMTLENEVNGNNNIMATAEGEESHDHVVTTGV
ncbi:organic solute transporter subunit alpha-like [Ptychodera flava]|uniref:organic solute transporter subunit alpha-like n=1 Tax=Ptychodera flava TaxID=63121 RepID=UPI003969E00F